MAKTIEKKLKEAVKKIPGLAEKEGWVLTLDRDEGALFYSPKSIPAKSTLFQVTDEYALYVDKGFNPRGVMIEYFNANFLKHHRGLEKLSKKLFGSSKKIATVDPHAKVDFDAFVLKTLLEGVIVQEALGMHGIRHQA